jgi:hypothetical protein
MPGTAIDTMVKIVRKDISLSSPHIYCRMIDMNILRPSFDTKLMPSLNISARSLEPWDN